MSLEKDLFTGSQLLSFCPSITLVSLSESLHHSFHTAVFMNNICHIASLSLKVTLVNYWSGQMITGLTSMFSSACRLSFHVYTLPLSIPGDPRMMNYCLLLLLGECWRLYRDMKCKITNVTMNVKTITLF